MPNNRISNMMMRLFRRVVSDWYLPVYLPLLMVLIKGVTLSIKQLYVTCLFPADIAFSVFAFDIYAFNMVSREFFIWPEAKTWLKQYGSGKTKKEFRSAEVNLVWIMVLIHLLVFLITVWKADSFRGVFLLVGIIISFGTYILPLFIVEGSAQKIWVKGSKLTS